MTLILTCICKDGVCVCADKRNTKKYSDGRVERKDILNKIYKFRDVAIIIFNHGINEINGRAWDSYCSVYEASRDWERLTFRGIVGDFQKFIERDVKVELSRNKRNRLDNLIAFVLCGKTSKDNRFEAGELCWSPLLATKFQGNFIRSGEGAKYLVGILRDNPELDTSEYWKNRNTAEGREKLRWIFLQAVGLKNKCNGQEFSDQFDLEVI